MSALTLNSVSVFICGMPMVMAFTHDPMKVPSVAQIFGERKPICGL
jgi:hypothetical protein